jgi:hypothetical protein
MNGKKATTKAMNRRAGPGGSKEENLPPTEMQSEARQPQVKSACRRKSSAPELEKPSDELELKGEIHKLRSATNKLIAIAGDFQDIDQATQVVQSIGLACTRMASLLKAQGKLRSESGDVDSVITRAITDAAAELRSRETKQKE